jgi:hypothetical protein|nr:MAG TPA: hypothetical protein [Caudoviricetes sp.]
MPKITIASLERRILVLESEKQTLGGQLSINGEFQLEAFKLLLERMKNENGVSIVSRTKNGVQTIARAFLKESDAQEYKEFLLRNELGATYQIRRISVE